MRNAINAADVPLKKFEDRELCMLIDSETVNAQTMSGGVLWMKPGAVVKPCHSHPNAEEILYIVKGHGKAWIDGIICDFKTQDCVYFPSGTKHMLKNTGKKTLLLFFVFSPPTDPTKNTQYPEIQVPNDW